MIRNPTAAKSNVSPSKRHAESLPEETIGGRQPFSD